MSFSSRCFFELLFKIFVLFLKVVDFLLEGQDGFPLDLKFVALSINFSNIDIQLFGELLGSWLVLILEEILQNISVQLFFLILC